MISNTFHNDNAHPRDEDAEKSVVGALMLDQSAHEQIPHLKGDDFYSDAHRRIFTAILQLVEDGKPCDSVTVANALNSKGWLDEVGGPIYLAHILETVPHSLHIKYYADIVVEKAQRRRIQLKCREIINRVDDPETDVGELLESIDFEHAPTSEQKFTAIGSEELANGDFELVDLIEGMLVKGQPCVFAGPKKSLKTNLSIFLALIMSIGGRYLGIFSVPKAVRVGVMSGESGAATIQETAKRIARSLGWTLGNFTNCFWSFQVPLLNSTAHLQGLRRFINEYKLEVLILDPTYLMMMLGSDANNLFVVGAMLKGLGEIAQETGVTLIICHHTKKSVAEPHEPPELEGIAWAGFQEWARQWLLIGRRQPYDPDNAGSHELWLSVGGSAGHSSLWGLNVEEGSRQDEGGRRWDMNVITASQARAEQAASRQETRQTADDVRRQAKLEKDTDSARSAFLRFPNGETSNKVRTAAGLSGTRFTPVLAELLRNDEIEECEIKKNGRTYEGFKPTPKCQSDKSDCPSRPSAEHTVGPPYLSKWSECVRATDMNDDCPSDLSESNPDPQEEFVEL